MRLTVANENLYPVFARYRVQGEHQARRFIEPISREQQKSYSLDSQDTALVLLKTFAVLRTEEDALSWVRIYGLPAYAPQGNSLGSRAHNNVDDILGAARSLLDFVYLYDSLAIAQDTGNIAFLENLVEQHPGEVFLRQEYFERATWETSDVTRTWFRERTKKEALEYLSTRVWACFPALEVAYSNAHSIFWDFQSDKIIHLPFSASAWKNKRQDCLKTLARSYLKQACNIMLRGVQPSLTIRDEGQGSGFGYEFKLLSPWHAIALAYVKYVTGRGTNLKPCPSCGDLLIGMRSNAGACRKAKCKKWVQRHPS